VLSVKKHIIIAALTALMLTVSLQGSVYGQNGQNKSDIDKLSQLISSMSQIQAYIEFYYMETGVYPKSLKDLEKIYNEEAVKEADKVVIPRDPITGKDFIYECNKEANTYRISCPDPTLYGMKKCELAPVKWGWMNIIPEEKKRKAYATFCRINLEAISAAIKKYTEQEKKAPKSLKEMVPAYLKVVPGCPLSGKDYVLTLKGNEIVITCPNPKEHGFTVFEIDSKSGFKGTPVPAQVEQPKTPGGATDGKKPGGTATPPPKTSPENNFK